MAKSSSPPSPAQLEAFWAWKRGELVRSFSRGRWSFDEFTEVWGNYKDKTTELPEKQTGDLTDYYYFRDATPSEYAAGPSEGRFLEYYNDRVRPIRRRRGLPE